METLLAEEGALVTGVDAPLPEPEPEPEPEPLLVIETVVDVAVAV